MRAPDKFIEAVLNKQFETAKSFLSAGTDINAGHGENGWTALHYSVENLLGEATQWLLENGADPNRRDTTGSTPLHQAVDAETDQDRQESVKTGVFQPTGELAALLLKYGADPNVKNKRGRTPLAIASAGGNSAAVEVLKRHGARDIEGDK